MSEGIIYIVPRTHLRDERWPYAHRSGPRAATVERELCGLYAGMPRKENLEGRYLAAVCPRCGGWTVFSTDPSHPSARAWMNNAYADGDLIVFWRNLRSLDQGCPDRQLPLTARPGDRVRSC